MASYLRIAAAVVFALLAVAFVALWVRSNDRRYTVGIPLSRTHTLFVESRTGIAFFAVSAPSVRGWQPPWDGGVLGFDFTSRLAFPHWFLTASSIGLAVLFAFKRTWRFSLRTVLVATTLLAAILGLAIYLI